ncbi:obscurin isoform X2 [Anguilla rostrata]|uniref:obscurin isoform X2 n=1 Tax=Anguilla rostrata TaxID=7938 RepID=UPI0030CBCA6A
MDVFGGAPRFLAYPRPVIVQSGTDAALKCQIAGDPRPAVIWERNNERIHPEGRYRLFEDGNVYNLIISGVTSEDSGQYICKAKNSIGETYAAATLKVEGEAQEKELREENRPRFLIKPLSTRVGRGEDAVFSCKLWGKPLPEVAWEKDGKRLNEIFESTHFSVSYQDGGWFQLKIFKTRAPDGGVYTCKAKNEFGEGLAGAVLLVDAGPGHEEEATRNGYANGHWKAHPGKARGGRQVATRPREEPLPLSAKVKMFAVTEGKHAKFRCYVTGKPKPEIIWRKDGRVILSGRRYLLYEDREGYFTLKVLYCKQQDNGVYVCAASNTAGQTLSAVHLTVKEPLVRFKQPLSDLEVFERELAILECEVPEDSIPITWYLEDRRLHPGAKYGMEEWGTKRRLTIRDIGADDDGIYLCEMADGGRSIAEVAVKGTIVRKLPRKVDVLEGENAAFCVEVEEEEMEIHWYKDGVELRETHQTIIKSFGKTHILVFVNASPQDSGKVTFIVGRSKTSSQLRVKAVRHSSPSCPVGVQINTERANAALLSWVPAPDSRRNPPSGYVLERQEVGSQEWLQCLTTDSATAVEILGDSVPCEADYRFRICSVNKYGRSSHVEFPRAAHLVPVAKIQTPLQDALVPEGQDASFTIELSASVMGTWFLNGSQLQEDERFAVRRSRTHHSLRVRGVRDADNGAEITFIACGVRDSAALYIQAPLVKFTPLSEMDRNKFVEVGNPIVLYCELSDPTAPVHWYKNGVELHTVEGLNIQSEGNMRRIVIQSAEFSHSGVYSCDAIDDVIRFNVEVEAPPVRFSALPEVAKSKSFEPGSPILLHCEISDPTAQVSWYKDGVQLHPQSGVEIQSEGTTRTLAVPSADILHSGVYSCKTKGDAIKFNVDIKAQPVKFSATPEVERNKSIDAGCPIVLHCEISPPNAQVTWYKDGAQLHPQSGVEIQSKATIRRLVVQSAQLCHSGVYRCEAADDAVQFTVDIKAPPVKFCSIPEDERCKSVEAGHPVVLNCQLSDPSAQVSWYKDGAELFPKAGTDLRSAGIRRTLVVESAQLSDSGVYCCSTADDAVQFNVKVKAPPVRFLNLPEDERNMSVEAGRPIVLHCEISEPTGQVSWYKDEEQLLPKTGVDIQSEGKARTLTIQSAELSHAGVYSCKTASEAIQFHVEVKEQFHSRPFSCEISDDTVQTSTDVKAASVDVSAEPEAKKIKYTEEAPPPAPLCEVIKPTAKDEIKPLQQTGRCIQSEGTMERVTDQSAQPPHLTQLIKISSETGRYVQSEDTMERDTDQSAQLPYLTQLIKNSSETGQYVQSEDTMEKETDQSAQLPALTHLKTNYSQTGRYIQSQGTMVRETDQSAQLPHLTHLRRNYSQTGQHIQSESTMERVTDQSAQPLPLTHLIKNSSETGRYVQSEDTMERDTDQSAQLPYLTQLIKNSNETGQYVQSEDTMERETTQSTQPPHLTHLRLNNSQSDRYIQKEDTVERETVQSTQPPHLTHLRSNNSQSDRYIQSEDTVERETDQSAQPLHLTQLRKNNNDPEQHIQSEGTVERVTDQSAQPPHLTHLRMNYSQTGRYIQSEDTVERETDQSARLPHLTQLKKNSSDAEEDATAFKVDVEAHPEDEKSNFVDTDWPTVQQCEISDPTSESKWSKDGQNLLPQNGTDIQSEGTTRGLTVQSAKLSHSRLNSCETMEDARQFHVDVKAPPVRLSALPEVEEESRPAVEADRPIVQHCEISELPAQVTAQVSRCQEGLQLRPQASADIQSDGISRTIDVRSAELSPSGVYSREAKDDGVQFNLGFEAPPAHFKELAEDDRSRSVEAGCPIVLQCEISDSNAQVSWAKDGVQLHPQSGVDIQSEGQMRKLVIQSAERSHSGVYSCGFAEEVVIFKVDVQDLPVKFSEIPEVAKSRSVEAGCPIVLHCEISDPTAQVTWYKDGVLIHPQSGVEIQSEDKTRTLTIQSAELCHAGTYRCETADDTMSFKVDVKAPPVKFSAIQEVQKSKSIEEGRPVVLHCEISDSTAQVSWFKDGLQLLPQSGVVVQSEGTKRMLILPSSGFSSSGVYSCKTADDVIEFYVDIKAPPVTFLDEPEENLHKSIVELDPLVLSCQVSRPNASVVWYKDGAEVQPSSNVTIQADGTMRRLILRSAQLSDAGIYTCRAGDNALIFKVNIREPPVMIIYPKEDVHLDRHVSEEVVLSCELSRSNGTVHWYKDGQKLQESQSIKLKSEGPYRRLKILNCGIEDSGEYVCDTADDSIFFQLNITEPPVSIVSPSQSQMELCQQTSERVVLSCEISRPNATVRWYRDGLEVEESNTLILEVDGVYRRLIIPETTVQDSAEYVCDTGDDSVTFFVNIAEPPVRFVRPRKMPSAVEILVGNPLVLECEVSRPSAEVSWKKDGEEMEDSRNVTIVEDGIFRQLTVHVSKFEHSGQYVCDAKDDVMDFHVKVTEPPVKILKKCELKTEQLHLESDDIVLECELSRANGAVRWSKDGQSVEENEHFCIEEEGAFRSLVILNAELSDAGEYACHSTDDSVVFNVRVKERPVAIVGNSESPEKHSLLGGDDLILACEVSRSNAPVEWYCNGRLLSPDARTHIDSYGTVRKLVLTGLRPSDSGEYTCDAVDDKMTTLVKVQEAPTKFLNKEKANLVTGYESESVTLSATTSRDSATVRWLKDWTQVSGERFHVRQEGNRHFLTIDPLHRSDSGGYTCDTTGDEVHFSLLVKEMRVKFVQALEDAVAHADGMVTLRCQLCRAKGDVLWLKDGAEIAPSRRLAIRADGPERSLTIHRLTPQDAGQYACESKDDRTSATLRVETPRVVEFIAELNSTTVMEGEDATFKCVVSPEDVQLIWQMDGERIYPSEKFRMSSNGLCHVLLIRSCQVTDSSKITAEAEGVLSRAKLQVQEAQVLFTKKMAAVEAEEFGEATLEVEVTPESGEVHWIRQNVVIQPGPKFSLKQNGPKRSLTVHNLSLSDRGMYRCETLHDRTQGKISVEPRKIIVRRGLTPIDTFERETATFEVELSHDNVEGVWQKDGVRLKPSSRWRPSAKGRLHSLTLSGLTLEDSGTVAFTAETARTSARLTVREPPVSILKKLEDQCSPEGSAVSLECELSRQNVDVKWLKNGSEVKGSKTQRIYSMGRKRFFQLMKCELSDSGVYMCDAGDISTSCSLEVYEQEVEIVQGLEDLDIQEDQNAVFMCEVSLPDIPGEWFRNGEKIRPTSTVKIRQEGTKHFLLICNVRVEDAGEIKFVAKQVESTASLEVEEMPVSIVKPLRDKTALEGHRVVLECAVSNPRCSIRWYQGSKVILPSERFEICSEGCHRKLLIQQVALEDEGTYSVQAGEHTTSARLTVEAQLLQMVRELTDVTVAAPDEARFECEVSIPVSKGPVWSLKEQTLHPGPTVRLEARDTVHRLTLKNTSADMSGVVRFSCAKAKSSARLTVTDN